ncbi:MAG: WYL domain-containing protein [Bacteroidetes bacterium]|nr:WYL domain-containing protein [Bacteroidota bacterium]
MTLEEITQTLWQASENKKACRIQLEGEFLPRTIYPYGVCTTSKNQIVLVCWQAMGFTKAGAKEGYRNLQLDKISEIEILSAHFQKRDDFNPADVQYKDWVYHI